MPAETKEQEVLHGRNYDHTSWREEESPPVSSAVSSTSTYSSSTDSSWNGDNFHDNALEKFIEPHQNPNTTIENSTRKRMLIASPTTSSPSSPSAAIRVSERCEDTEEESMRKKQKTEFAKDSHIKQKKECLDMNEQLKQSGAADYLIRTYKMISDCSDKRSDLAAWSNENEPFSFIIKDKDELERVMIPSYFKSSTKFDSFSRSLNFYGFKKETIAPPFFNTNNEGPQIQFSHENFKRGSIHLLNQIKRSTNKSRDNALHTCSSVEQQTQDIMILKERVANLESDRDQQKVETESLKNLIRRLIGELNSLREQTDSSFPQYLRSSGLSPAY